jgi:2-dehydro-3-deoxyphosphooctonate aldolase (KDO 8-P synthase)
MKSGFKFTHNNESNPNLFIIAGPCVIESKELCLTIASRLAELSLKLKVDIIFKSSFDKANRTSGSSFRGPGKEEGLRILEEVRRKTGLAILTDIHESIDAAQTASVADILQIPAFLCRQTDLLQSARDTGCVVNVKKGQFMAPQDMKFSIEKAGPKSWITERGTFFGYNRLVVDFAGIPILKTLGRPVIFDATHSVQNPGGGDGCSSGNRALALPLAKAALSMGVDGLFFETHTDPDKALCDGPNSLDISVLEKNLPFLIELFHLDRSRNGQS